MPQPPQPPSPPPSLSPWPLLGAPLLAVFVLISTVAATCDQQDFIPLTPDLWVSASGSPRRLLAESDTVFHNGVYRQALDFTLANPSALPTEVVVFARSAVREGNNERLVGERLQVFPIAAGESINSRFSDLDLKSGTTIGVQLQCCAASFCEPSSVECPNICSTKTLDPPTADNPNPTTCTVNDHSFQLNQCTSSSDICNEGCLVNNQYDLACIVACMTFYRRCCPDQTTSTTEIPCCLEPCAAQRCVAGQVECSASTDCTVFPEACLDGCLGDGPFDLDTRCVASCMTLHSACCGAAAPAPDVQIPCCFEPGCDQVDRPKAERTRCSSASFVCAPDEACTAPEVCLTSCLSDAGVIDAECTGTCMQQFNRCCGRPDLPPFPSVEVPCCFDACEQGNARCPLSEFQCPRTGFRCDAFPSACVDGCLDSLGKPDLACVVSCFNVYENCCKGSIPVDLNQQIPCCFATHCEANMTGLIKLSSIECRNDAECGTGQVCNDRSLCESTLQDGQSTCSIGRKRLPPAGVPVWWAALLVVAASWGWFRFRGFGANSESWRLRVLYGCIFLLCVHTLHPVTGRDWQHRP